MKNLLLNVLICFVFGQTGTAQFKITGKVNYPQESNDIYLVKLDLDNSNHQIVDTVELYSDGTFVIHSKDAVPNVYLLSFYKKQRAFLVIDKGQEIQLTVDGNQSNGVLQITGSKDTELLMQYHQRQKIWEKQYLEEIVTQIQTAQQQNDAAKVQELSKVYVQKLSELNHEISIYITEHLAPSLAALATFIDWKSDEELKIMEQVIEKIEAKRPDLALTQAVKNRVSRFKKFAIGSVAPDIEEMNPAGEQIKLSSLKGKYVLIDFWASWCGPCRMENPNIVKVYEKYKTQGFDIFGVSLDNNKEKWMAAIKNDGLNWTNVSDLKGWQARPAALYNVRSIPTNFLLDREGRIIAKNLRGEDLEAEMQKIFGKQ